MRLMILSLILFGVITLAPTKCEGHRILGAFPHSARSHFMMFEALMKGLARKGHQVDVLSIFPQKKYYPNYTDIELPLTSSAVVNNITHEVVKSITNDPVKFATEMGSRLCEGLGNPNMLKLIQNPPTDPPYDLVITEVCETYCYVALGHYLKVPVVGVSSSALYPWMNGIIGNPANLAFVPNNLVNYIAPMTFWQRLHNTVTDVYNDLYFQYLTTEHDEIIKKYLGEKAPSVREATRSLALIFTNSHLALNGPKPVTPAVIEVGGLHVQDDDAELSLDLKEWMDDSTDGVVYFSFGSMVVIETLPEDILQVFYKSLDKIAPIRVLMKVQDPRKLPPGLPKNIRTFKWAPQYKVFKHKNVKAFITHGGLMGTQEAIHCAVPMIGIPLMADQFVNVELYTKKQIAVRLAFKSITEDKLDTALNEILFNPEYKDTIRKVSEIFLDRPMTSMETATWWVEYVIRRGNVLRSPAMELTWWQLALLDVYTVFLIFALFSIFITISLLRFIINSLSFLVHPKVTYSKKVR